jgi:hypothetical protein
MAEEDTERCIGNLKMSWLKLKQTVNLSFYQAIGMPQNLLAFMVRSAAMTQASAPVAGIMASKAVL